MIYPTTSSLLTKVDSKYTLVMEVAKRARQLIAGEKPLIEEETDASAKPVSVAVREVTAGQVTYKRMKDSMK